MRIRTEFVYPPIPIRQFDWSAVDDDTYDGPGSPIGSGKTQGAAIMDLIEQIGSHGAWDIPGVEWGEYALTREWRCLLAGTEANWWLTCFPAA